MGKNSGISWTDNTFNPWWGCEKVSPGCANCYAETFSKRYGLDIWGSTSERRFFGEKHWNEPRLWNHKARIKGIPETVFCGSMCDILEDRPDLDHERIKLWKLIEDTTSLDGGSLIWLLLTKRPENLTKFIPADWLYGKEPSNVWWGVTVESQSQLRKSLFFEGFEFPVFISVEPMIGPVVLGKYREIVDWVICGGESGPHCRPMDLEWAKALKTECDANYIPFFMKQLGGYPNKRHDMEKWPEELQVQNFPDWSEK